MSSSLEPLLREDQTLEESAPHLAQETPDFVSLADVSIRSSTGPPLPAHSQVLARHSAVAGALVASMHEAGNPPSCREPLCMGSLFDADREVVITLLKCFYGFPPVELFNSCSPALLQSLLRLAHKLDASSVIAKLQSYLVSDTRDAVTRDTLGWLGVAEDLQLDELRGAVLRLLIWQLGQRPATVSAVMKDPAWQALDRNTLLLVLDAVTARPDFPGGVFTQRDIESWGGPGWFTSQAVLQRADQQAISLSSTATPDINPVGGGGGGGGGQPGAAQGELQAAVAAQLEQAQLDFDEDWDQGHGLVEDVEDW